MITIKIAYHSHMLASILSPSPAQGATNRLPNSMPSHHLTNRPCPSPPLDSMKSNPMTVIMRLEIHEHGKDM